MTNALNHHTNFTKQKKMTENDIEEIFLNACKNGDLQKVQALMETNEIYNGILYDGLCQAASDGNMNLIKFFLDRKVDIEDLENSTTPLHEAVRNDQEDVVEFLIDKGARVNYYLDYFDGMDEDDIIKDTPLNLAIEKGFLGIVEILVENDADVNGYTDIEATPMRPFCRAIELGQKEIAEYLSENGARCLCGSDEYYSGCLEKAIDKGSVDDVKFLLENDVEADLKDLRHAITLNHEDIAEYLLENWTFTGIECVFEAIREGENTFKFLLEKSSEFPEQINLMGGNDLQKALNKAVIDGSYYMVQFFIEKGADTKKRDKNNKTLFDIAYERKAKEKVLRLFDEKCPSGRMQMVIEKLKGSYKKNSVILRNFIEEFSLEMTDCHGMNLLHYACKEGIVNLVKDLVKLGADINGAMTAHCRYYNFISTYIGH